jgi:hypothetical protein
LDRAGFSRRTGRARTFVVYLRRLAVDLVPQRAFQDVDDLLTRMKGAEFAHTWDTLRLEALPRAASLTLIEETRKAL